MMDPTRPYRMMYAFLLANLEFIGNPYEWWHDQLITTERLCTLSGPTDDEDNVITTYAE